MFEGGFGFEEVCHLGRLWEVVGDTAVVDADDGRGGGGGGGGEEEVEYGEDHDRFHHCFGL